MIIEIKIGNDPNVEEGLGGCFCDSEAKDMNPPAVSQRFLLNATGVTFPTIILKVIMIIIV